MILAYVLTVFMCFSTQISGCSRIIAVKRHRGAQLDHSCTAEEDFGRTWSLHGESGLHEAVEEVCVLGLVCSQALSIALKNENHMQNFAGPVKFLPSFRYDESGLGAIKIESMLKKLGTNLRQRANSDENICEQVSKEADCAQSN